MHADKLLKVKLMVKYNISWLYFGSKNFDWHKYESNF
jgi:hypothetical protein